MTRWFLLLLSCSAFGLLSPMEAHAQRERSQDPARQRKAQLKMKRDREKQNEDGGMERKTHAQEPVFPPPWRHSIRVALSVSNF